MSARTLVSAALLALAAGVPTAAGASSGLNGYIAYGSSRTGSAFSDDIYVTPLDVETPAQLTFRRADDGQPSFSPDGRRIAFKTAQFGSNQLAVMNADGTGEQLLTRTFRFSEGQPSWSADGTQLFYRRTPENPLVQHGEIWSLDVAASAADPANPVTHRVLATAGDIRYPTVSPDGSRIAFRAGDLVEANGDEEVRHERRRHGRHSAHRKRGLRLRADVGHPMGAASPSSTRRATRSFRVRGSSRRRRTST